MVRPSALLSAKFEGAVKDGLAPDGRKVVEIVAVSDASSIIALYEGPIAIRVKQEETFAASVVDGGAWKIGEGDSCMGTWGRLVRRHQEEGH
jgi:hypothetical protein